MLGLLGHNGAGKTTAIRILTTLSTPTEGTATVAGFDVVADAGAVRARIGVAAQQATVDGLLERPDRTSRWSAGCTTCPSRGPRAGRRAARAARPRRRRRPLVKTFSGGMRRRLDLAASLVATPQVLFLDEPTTGLDPRSRNDLWEMLRELVARRHHHDPHHAVPRGGRPPGRRHRRARPRRAPSPTARPDELKARIGDDRIDVKVTAGERARSRPRPAGRGSPPATPTFDGEQLRRHGVRSSRDVRLIDVVRALDEAGIDAADINRRQATLDDVFLTLTGRRAPMHRSRRPPPTRRCRA